MLGHTESRAITNPETSSFTYSQDISEGYGTTSLHVNKVHSCSELINKHSHTIMSSDAESSSNINQKSDHPLSEDIFSKHNVFVGIVGTNDRLENRLKIETSLRRSEEDACTTRESSVCTSVESLSRSVSRCDSKPKLLDSEQRGGSYDDRKSNKRAYGTFAGDFYQTSRRPRHRKVNYDDRRSSSRCRTHDRNRKLSRHGWDRRNFAHEHNRQSPRYDYSFADLPLEWWDRTEDCKDAKVLHTERIDHICASREDLVLQTTLWKENTVLEPNMFPYDCPKGIEHYTLWSIRDLGHNEIVRFVDDWLRRRFPRVRRWQYDDNSGERSIELFHVHIFIEMDPYSFVPDPEKLYVPPHLVPPQ